MNEVVIKVLAGERGVRFAGPDLLYYEFLIRVTGGKLDGSRIRVRSQFFPCCGVLQVEVRSLDDIEHVWSSGYSGCELHQHKEIGNVDVRDFIWGLDECLVK